MLIKLDGVKCSKLVHLKHFILNAAKNLINSSQILVESTEAWKEKSHFGGGHCPSLPFLKSTYDSSHVIIQCYTIIVLYCILESDPEAHSDASSGHESNVSDGKWMLLLFVSTYVDNNNCIRIVLTMYCLSFYRRIKATKI